MEENKKEVLKKGLLKPGSDFTSNLMNKINAEEIALSNILSSKGSVSTSTNFTAQLMSQLKEKSLTVPYKPVISKKAWAGIAAVFIGFIFLTLFSGTESIHKIDIEVGFQHLKNGIDSFFSSETTFHYIMYGVLLLSLGLIVEQKVSRRRTI